MTIRMIGNTRKISKTAASGAGGEGSAGLYHYHSFEHALELRFADSPVAAEAIAQRG